MPVRRLSRRIPGWPARGLRRVWTQQGSTNPTEQSLARDGDAPAAALAVAPASDRGMQIREYAVAALAAFAAVMLAFVR